MLRRAATDGLAKLVAASFLHLRGAYRLLRGWASLMIAIAETFIGNWTDNLDVMGKKSGSFRIIWQLDSTSSSYCEASPELLALHLLDALPRKIDLPLVNSG